MAILVSELQHNASFCNLVVRRHDMEICQGLPATGALPGHVRVAGTLHIP